MAHFDVTNCIKVRWSRTLTQPPLFSSETMLTEKKTVIFFFLTAQIWLIIFFDEEDITECNISKTFYKPIWCFLLWNELFIQIEKKEKPCFEVWEFLIGSAQRNLGHGNEDWSQSWNDYACIRDGELRCKQFYYYGMGPESFCSVYQKKCSYCFMWIFL